MELESPSWRFTKYISNSFKKKNLTFFQLFFIKIWVWIRIWIKICIRIRYLPKAEIRIRKHFPALLYYRTHETSSSSRIEWRLWSGSTLNGCKNTARDAGNGNPPCGPNSASTVRSSSPTITRSEFEFLNHRLVTVQGRRKGLYSYFLLKKDLN